ncbi:lipid asymmetry maintenance protein MlaB [Limnobacter sp.]|uniref:STAS domain-containing protein n=1 Tax=Limnobacter sp. TaxID=2003368 RepID=UPI003512C1FC
MKDELEVHGDLAVAADPVAEKAECRISLEELSIGCCASLAEQIRQGLAEGQHVLLDLRQCQEVDTAGLQLLLCIQNDPAVNLHVHWTAPSEVLALKAARLGVSSWINAGVVER